VSSLVASGLAIVVGWFSSRRARAWLIAGLSRLSGVGLLRTYETQKTANANLIADLSNAEWIKALVGRGNELTRDSFGGIWNSRSSHLNAIQLLLPNSQDGSDTWLRVRESELARIDTGYGKNVLADQVMSNVRYLQEVSRGRSDVELRLYDAPNVCRIIATNRVAYVTTYPRTRHGRNAPCLVFSRGSVMYDHFVRMFDTIWEVAGPPPRLDAISES
jgi:hypothetical protein